MAERLSVKDMLAAARKGGAAKPAGEPAAVEIEAEAPAAEVVEVEAAAAPAAAVPTAESLGRPLTMKEKLAAARGGGAATAKPAPAAAKAAAPASETVVEVIAPVAHAAPVPTAEALGRPLTMKEKLAAARGGAAPAAPAAEAKPAAAKAAAPAAAAAKASARELPPLEKITDPRDLAEALRRAGADKDKAAKADAAAKAASTAGATPATALAAAKASAAKKLETKTIPPKPSKEGTAASTSAPPGTAPASVGRRPFLWGMGIGAIIVTGWANFVFGITAQTLACVRFMFPNVLAEPPSTIKVGLATNFEPEQVNDRWKAEWGFWIVRSAAYDGEDKIYAIQSVCTHLGCPPNWLAAEAKFKCPCHGSGFYISGVNFEGPAPRPLERFKVALNEAGEIVVDKGQKFQEELKQWSDADSFIIA